MLATCAGRIFGKGSGADMQQVLMKFHENLGWNTVTSLRPILQCVCAYVILVVCYEALKGLCCTITFRQT